MRLCHIIYVMLGFSFQCYHSDHVDTLVHADIHRPALESIIVQPNASMMLHGEKK